MGTVACRDTWLDREVAVKEVRLPRHAAVSAGVPVWVIASPGGGAVPILRW